MAHTTRISIVTVILLFSLKTSGIFLISIFQKFRKKWILTFGSLSFSHCPNLDTMVKVFESYFKKVKRENSKGIAFDLEKIITIAHNVIGFIGHIQMCF